MEEFVDACTPTVGKRGDGPARSSRTKDTRHKATSRCVGFTTSLDNANIVCNCSNSEEEEDVNGVTEDSDGDAR